MSPLRSAPEPPAAAIPILRLYIAGKAPNSIRALRNLEAICRNYLKSGYELEVIDVFEHPLRALADGILVTPCLAKLAPLPVAMIAGKLSETGKVLLALGLTDRLI